MMRTEDRPTRFEDEYPEEAQALMTICANPDLRKAIQAQEATHPESDRIFKNVNPIGPMIFEFRRNMFAPSFMQTGTPYKRSEPKVGRNEPCPCGSGNKYKKCCA
jgi:uncharacterized protein YecA (UPF0149 family)